MLTTCFNDIGKIDNEEFNRLVGKFHTVINFYAHKYYIAGGGSDDLYQWGLIGLYKAVLGYEENSEHSFNLIAKVNIRNMMKSAITQANRQKYKFANEAQSLFAKDCGNTGMFLIDKFAIPNSMEDPLTVVSSKEFVENILQLLENRLSVNERRIMILYINGYKQRHICKVLSIQPKTVDNAIQRARKKLAYYRNNL